ncbi:uncharacterized protein BDV14DRAFT_166126 [Aspergillus stella-maris]|uniref:uncharacterized protein n=1 Tax=Aspergillus stella-maris TaxID=1810926 RepID=UPI003CCDE338
MMERNIQSWALRALCMFFMAHTATAKQTTPNSTNTKIQSKPRYYDSNNKPLKDWQRNIIIAFAVVVFAACLLFSIYRYRRRQQSKGRDIEMGQIHRASLWDRPAHSQRRGRGPIPAPFPTRMSGRGGGWRGRREQTPPPPYAPNAAP